MKQLCQVFDDEITRIKHRSEMNLFRLNDHEMRLFLCIYEISGYLIIFVRI